MKRIDNIKNIRNNKGIAAILIAVLMLCIICFAALAIDIGYMYIVKGQLQNAADACALAGAGALYPDSPTAAIPPPNWPRAQTTAAAFVTKNKAAGADLTDAQVEYGYWNLATRDWKAGSPVTTGTPPGPPSGNCSVTLGPCTAAAGCPQYPSEACVIQEVAAVKATISKVEGANGGPVPTYFARVLGFDAMAAVANGFAARGAPSSVKGAFPFAISGCAVNDYFSQTPLPDPPTTITDTSVYHMRKGGDVVPGQWTDLKPVKDPDAKLLKDYIDNMVDPAKGTEAPALQAGNGSTTYIYIDPGTKAAVYHSTQEYVDFMTKKGEPAIVVMPVVGTPTDCTVAPNSAMLVTGFVAFEITGTTNSSMTGHFVGYYQSPPGSITGGSSTNNTFAPPVLIR